jgi:hypothetical protein
VLFELIENYGYEGFIDDMFHFRDVFKYEKEDSELAKAYKSLSVREEFEVIKVYVAYLEVMYRDVI